MAVIRGLEVVGCVVVVEVVGEVGVTVVVVVGFGLVCRGGGSCVGILCSIFVPLSRCKSIIVLAGPMYPGSLGSL